MPKGIYPIEKRRGLFKFRCGKKKTICVVCSKEFFVHPYRLKNNCKYCSKECWAKRNPQKQFECGTCHKQYSDYAYKIKFKHHYCSGYCRLHINPKKPVICKGCGKTFYEWDANRNKKTHKGVFCSLDCKNRYCVLDKHPSWLGGKSFEPYGLDFDKIFKEVIRERDGFACLKCNLLEEDCKKLYNRKLVVHHIDYNKKLTIPENCCSLCVRCHTETNFNRSHWTKFFQSLLAERYGYKYSEDDEIILNLNGECE
jgi:hypothetical protein